MEDIELLHLYQIMQTIRRIEKRIYGEYLTETIKTPLSSHLSIGQEAVVAGVSIHLRSNDIVISVNRKPAYHFAKSHHINNAPTGYDLQNRKCRYIKNLFFNPGVDDTKCSSTSLPFGISTALASKLLRNDKVTAVFFEHSEADEDVVHDSLDFASLYKLPVVYVCINTSHAADRNGKAFIYQWAKDYGIPGYRIDGNEAIEVSDYANRAILRCRKGYGPTLLECFTYCWDDFIQNTGEKGETCFPYHLKCPIQNLKEQMVMQGILNEELENRINTEITREIDDAFFVMRQNHEIGIQ